MKLTPPQARFHFISRPSVAAHPSFDRDSGRKMSFCRVSLLTSLYAQVHETQTLPQQARGLPSAGARPGWAGARPGQDCAEPWPGGDWRGWDNGPTAAKGAHLNNDGTLRDQPRGLSKGRPD